MIALNKFVHKNKQQGAVLAISLILMVAMTILGVATLNGTRLAEKVSSNAQQKTIVFESAESAINAVYSADDLVQRLSDSRSSPDEPDAVVQLIESTDFGTELDQSNDLGTTVDLDTEVTVQFCEEYVKAETEFNAEEGGTSTTIGYAHDIRAVASIANTKALSDNVLRVGDSGPKVGAKGKCVVLGS